MYIAALGSCQDASVGVRNKFGHIPEITRNFRARFKLFLKISHPTLDPIYVRFMHKFV
jgi:hypothetical protein